MATLSRRLFLRSAGASAATLATIATPAIVEAAQGELSELLDAGRALPEAIAKRDTALRALDEAHTEYLRLCPPVPDEIVGSKHALGNSMRWWTERETDWRGNDLWPVDKVAAPRQIFHSAALDRDCPHLHRRGKIGNHWRRIRSLAAEYEAAQERARNDAGVPAASEAHYYATEALRRLASNVADVAPQSLAGLIIKARVIDAYSRCDGEAKAWALGSARQLPADIIALFGGEA